MRTSYDRPKMESWVFLFFFREDVSLGCPYPSIQLPPPSKSIKILLLSHMKDEGGGSKNVVFLCPSILFFLFSLWWPPPTNQPTSINKQQEQRRKKKTFLFSLAKIRFFTPHGPILLSFPTTASNNTTPNAQGQSLGFRSGKVGRRRRENLLFHPIPPMSTRGRKICPNCESWGFRFPTQFRERKKTGATFLGHARRRIRRKGNVWRSVGRSPIFRPPTLAPPPPFFGGAKKKRRRRRRRTRE